MNDLYIPGTTIIKPVVTLTGINGNAYVILGHVKKALKRAGCNAASLKQFTDEATSSDYDHLLQTCLTWVTAK